jgi:hypothetical protein
MSELRQIIPVSDWLEFDLNTQLVEPPVVRLRLRPVTGVSAVDIYAEGGRKLSDYVLGQAIEAIAEWDLTRDGVAVPCTAEAKREMDFHLRLLLAQPMRDGSGDFLELRVVEHAAKAENYLKN